MHARGRTTPKPHACMHGHLVAGRGEGHVSGTFYRVYLFGLMARDEADSSSPSALAVELGPSRHMTVRMLGEVPASCRIIHELQVHRWPLRVSVRRARSHVLSGNFTAKTQSEHQNVFGR